MLRSMANFRGWEWIIILALALLLFGGFKKMPDAARGLGRSLRIFKSETKGLVDDDKSDDAGNQSAGTMATSDDPVASAPPIAAPRLDEASVTTPPSTSDAPRPGQTA